MKGPSSRLALDLLSIGDVVNLLESTGRERKRHEGGS